MLVRVTLAGICCGVEVSPEGRISRTAPLLSRFAGQPLENLTRWVLSKGGAVERLR